MSPTIETAWFRRTRVDRQTVKEKPDKEKRKRLRDKLKKKYSKEKKPRFVGNLNRNKKRK